MHLSAYRLELLETGSCHSAVWVYLGEVTVHSGCLLILSDRVVGLAEEIVSLVIVRIHADELLQCRYRLFGLAAGKIVAGDHCLLLGRLRSSSGFQAVLHKLLAQGHVIGAILDGLSKQLQRLGVLPAVPADIRHTLIHQGGLFQLSSAGMDIGQLAKLGYPLIKKAARHMDVRQLTMHRRVIRSDARHLLQHGDGVLLLLAVTEVTHQLCILLKCRLRVKLARRYLSQSSIDLVTIRDWRGSHMTRLHLPYL